MKSVFAPILVGLTAAIFITPVHAAGGVSKCDRQLVMQIDSAKISVEPGGFSVDAFGVSESAGWSNPTLVVSGTGPDGVANADFMACRPEVSAQVLTPIQVHQTLDLNRATTRKIVIRTRTNSMTVEITQPK
jgi:hypothetical protein